MHSCIPGHRKVRVPQRRRVRKYAARSARLFNQLFWCTLTPPSPSKSPFDSTFSPLDSPNDRPRLNIPHPSPLCFPLRENPHLHPLLRPSLRLSLPGDIHNSLLPPLHTRIPLRCILLCGTHRRRVNEEEVARCETRGVGDAADFEQGLGGGRFTCWVLWRKTERTLWRIQISGGV